MTKVAVCQMGSVGTREENMEKMISYIEKAAAEQPGLDVIVFPEYTYYSPVNLEESKEIAVDLNRSHVFVDTMKSLARRHHVNLIPGSFVTLSEDGRVKNTSVIINRKGEIIGKYDKVHLMKAAAYDESAYVSAGDKFCVADTDFGRVGLMVCYDLRFPEQARSMCLAGAKIIFVPAMFPSGQPLPVRVDDWDILVRSTALTNMTYVVAANQFGMIHGDMPFGRTCVVDPKGIVISAASGREGVIYSDIDLEYEEQMQENMGVWKNRRPELYRL